MNYIIFDLEATCIEDNRNFINETIEIGAIKLNEKLEIIDTFDEFVKPILNPKLSDYCKHLTSITQDNVDNAKSFKFVFPNFYHKMASSEEIIFCAWGYYDKMQIIKDSILHQLSYDFMWMNNYISLKHQFAEFMHIKPCGMMKALKMLKLEAEGFHHRAIDDVKNISKIFINHFNYWDFTLEK